MRDGSVRETMTSRRPQTTLRGTSRFRSASSRLAKVTAGKAERRDAAGRSLRGGSRARLPCCKARRGPFLPEFG